MLLLIILFNFIAGSLCLIYGVNLMSGGLETLGLKRIKKYLSVCTGNVFFSFITGMVVTALTQSSTAVTVITVGFVNSGLLNLSQAVGVIYGANIGTTITAQLMSFNLTDFAFPILLISITLSYFVKKPSYRRVCQVIIGFGLMLSGIGILNRGIPYIRKSSFVHNLFIKHGDNPLVGLFTGIVITMLVHSSSATVGLTMVLFNSGLITFGAALGLTLGDNIGTCITAQLASIGANIPARRTAWSHTLYNIIGVLIAMAFLSPFARFTENITSFLGQGKEKLVANAHSMFNILSAAVFLPVTGIYIKFIEWIVPDRKK